MTTTFNKLSITQLGEQFADTNLSSQALAREVKTRLPNYVDKQDKETKKAFMKGFSNRFFKEYPNLDEFYIEEKGAYKPVSKAEFDKAGQGIVRHRADSDSLISWVENGSKWSALKKADPVMYELKKADREKLRKFRNDQHAKLLNAIKALDKKPVERVVKNMLEIANDSIKAQIDRLKKQVDKNDDFALSMQKEYYAWLQDGKRLIENIKRNTK